MQINQIDINTSEENSLVRDLHISLSAPEITKQVQDELHKIQRTAKMPGFRPGKVPLKILDKQHRQQIQWEVSEKIIGQALRETITENDFNLASQASLKEVNIDDPNAITFSATLELLPEIDLIDFSTLEIKRFSPLIEESEIDNEVQTLLDKHSEWNVKEAPDDVVEMGDKVIVDCNGLVEGKPFDQGDVEDQEFQTGRKILFEEVEQAIMNQPVNETVTATLTYPENSVKDNLQGKTATLTIKIKKILSPQAITADSPEFLEKTGFGTGGLVALKENILNALSEKRAENYALHNKHVLFDELLEQHSFELPPTLLAMELEQIINHTKEEKNIASEQSLSEEQLQDCAETADRRVRLGLLFRKLITTFNITENQVDVTQHVQKMLHSMFGENVSEELFAAAIKNKKLIEEARTAAIEAELMKKIYELANIAETPTTIESLVKASEDQAKQQRAKNSV